MVVIDDSMRMAMMMMMKPSRQTDDPAPTHDQLSMMLGWKCVSAVSSPRVCWGDDDGDGDGDE